MQEFGITRIDDGDRLVGGLSGGERQSLAIARAVHFGASVLILDEPTAALGVKEAAHVLRIVMQARRKGLAVIFITHHVIARDDGRRPLRRPDPGAMAADFRKGEKTPRGNHRPDGRRRGDGRARGRDRELHGRRTTASAAADRRTAMPPWKRRHLHGGTQRDPMKISHASTGNFPGGATEMFRQPPSQGPKTGPQV